MIIAVTGSNAFLRQQKLDQIVDKFVEKYGALPLEKIDCEEVELPRIIESLTAYSLFSSDKLVILRSPSTQKYFADEVDKLIEQIPTATQVVIIEPKLDKRTAYYKALKNKTEFYEYSELQQPDLNMWVMDFAEQQGGNINNADANYLVQRIGPNQQYLAQELKKLVIYNPKISQQIIDLLTEKTPQGTVFELLDAAFAGNLRRALALYKEQREMRVEPLAIMGMLAWQLNVLAIVKTANNRDSREIASQAKLNPFVVQKANALTRNLSLGDIKRLVSETLSLDIRLKRESIDADEAMNLLLINIAAAR